jgi:hypothetical protein
MPTITFLSSSTISETTHCDLFVCSRNRKSVVCVCVSAERGRKVKECWDGKNGMCASAYRRSWR